MCPISGGNWNNTSNAGVWAFSLATVRGNSNNNVGFRADSASPHIGQPKGGTKGGAFRQPWAAKSVGHSGTSRARAGLDRHGVGL